MENQHTPGSWDEADNDPLTESIIELGYSRQYARLIAAAPALLDALIQCQADLAALLDTEQNPDLFAGPAMARAALKQAKGL